MVFTSRQPFPTHADPLAPVPPPPPTHHHYAAGRVLERKKTRSPKERSLLVQWMEKMLIRTGLEVFPHVQTHVLSSRRVRRHSIPPCICEEPESFWFWRGSGLSQHSDSTGYCNVLLCSMCILHAVAFNPNYHCPSFGPQQARRMRKLKPLSITYPPIFRSHFGNW